MSADLLGLLVALAGTRLEAAFLSTVSCPKLQSHLGSVVLRVLVDNVGLSQ